MQMTIFCKKKRPGFKAGSILYISECHFFHLTNLLIYIVLCLKQINFIFKIKKKLLNYFFFKVIKD